jgi:serine protease AprX
LDIVVFLTDQPAAQIAQEVRDEFDPTLRRIADELRMTSRLVLPSSASLTEAQEKELLKRIPPVPHVAQVALLEEYDQVRNTMLGIVMRRAETAARQDQAAMKALIERLGGTYRSATTVVNAVSATIPARAVYQLADDPRVAIVALDQPGRPELDISVPTIGAPTGFWANGITGGTFDAGVLDTGVQINHPAFAGHLFSTSNGGIDTNGHGTAMAGIMASVDATRRGVAYGCQYIAAAIAGADSTSMSGMNWLMNTAADRPEAINYSFGNGTANAQDYAPIDQFFDSVIDTFAVMVSKSTGNGGFGSGAPTITHPAPAFNLMATANMNDFNTLARTDDRISSSSSRGPTVSGRKKPDITAPGTNIVSPTPAGGWTGITGTSPAAPHVGGSVLLMMHRGILDPFAAEAVLLNAADAIDDLGTSGTTDDVWVNGSLWNRRYGWGYLDLAEAYVHSLDVFSRTFAAPPVGGRRYRFFKGNMLTNEKATLAWNRHATYNGAAYPTIVRALSNLDLQCWNQATGAMSVQSASTIDNVEQLSVTSNMSVVLKVLTVGAFDPQVAQERFALATEENFVEATGPALTVLPPNGEVEYVAGSQANVIIRVRNDGDLPAFNVMVGISNVSTVSPANPQNVGTIQPGQTVQATWLVQMPTQSVEMVVGGSASSSSFGETFTGSASGFIVVGNESFLSRWLR